MATADNDAMIETHGLTKMYAAGRGCRDINLSIGRGRVFGLLGPNGAGKSTFVKLLVGLIRPTSGKARIMGFPLGHLGIRKHIGYLPELFRYQDWLSGREVLGFHGRLCRIDRSVLPGNIEEVLALTGLKGREHDRVKQYSKGMQQRLGMACALLNEPSLVFLDEPASALDPIGRHEVRKLLARLKAKGTTVFLNTHLLEDVQEVCDEVGLILNGELKAAGPVDALLRREANWRIRVGGYMPELLAAVEQVSGVPVRLRQSAQDGSAELEAQADNEELAGWLIRVLVEHGFTVYEAGPDRPKLDAWFLEMVEREERTSG